MELKEQVEQIAKRYRSGKGFYTLTIMESDVVLTYIDNQQKQIAEKNKRIAELEVATFPMLDGPKITRCLAEQIYKKYVERFGRCQTLDRIAERGGFEWSEIPYLYKTQGG